MLSSRAVIVSILSMGFVFGASNAFADSDPSYFNPAISAILNGRYAGFSQDESEIKGFAIGEEGERGKRGFALDETEINLSANVDDKFYGSLTAALVQEHGEDHIELEEAFVQTTPGFGLPRGLSVKAGRALWTLGYLNEHHTHTDDFTDRPLPYRVFLNKAYNDDGIEFTYVFPTSFYSEIGGAFFRGEAFPGGNASGKGFHNYSLFARVGGDIRENHNWRLGAYRLETTASGSEGRVSNEDELVFIGHTGLYIVDFRYEWLPCGNPRHSMLSLQGEYFWQHEGGEYHDNTLIPADFTPFDSSSNGWYAQAVYKFTSDWRVGARHTRLQPPGTVPAALAGGILDAQGYSPYINSAMVDWTPSEFSRLRLQYNQDKTVAGQTDHQILLQYIMSIGAHGAHQY